MIDARVRHLHREDGEAAGLFRAHSGALIRHGHARPDPRKMPAQVRQGRGRNLTRPGKSPAQDKCSRHDY